MPNYTFCKFKAPEDVLKKYMNKDEDGKDIFDFNLVIPMPPELLDPDVPSGSDEDKCIYWYLSEKDTIDRKTVLHSHKDIFSEYFKFMLIQSPDYEITGTDEMYERGKKYVTAYEKYGYRDWYDWAIANWGTKWNAFDCKYDASNDYVEFDTAWAAPYKVIEKIFNDNPGCMLAFFWTNEDYDGQHHLIRYKNGNVHRLNCDGYFQNIK